MIVLADDLQDVAGFERDPGLGARYQLVLQRIIVKLCSNEYLSVQKDRNINIFRRVPEREKFVSIGCCIGDPIWDRWNDIERFFYKYRWNVMCKRCAGSRVRVKLEKIGLDLDNFVLLGIFRNFRFWTNRRMIEHNRFETWLLKPSISITSDHSRVGNCTFLNRPFEIPKIADNYRGLYPNFPDLSRNSISRIIRDNPAHL